MLHLEVYKNISSLKSDMAGNWGTYFNFKMDYYRANIWRASFFLFTWIEEESWLPWCVF